MSLFRFNERGSFVIDKRFRGIGRIRRASGTSDKKTFRAILAMLAQLYSTGKHEVLREIQSGSVTPLEAFGYWTAEQLAALPSVATLKLVSPTVENWTKTHDVEQITRRNYVYAIRRFIKVVGNPSLIKLPDAIAQYRAYCDDHDLHRSFNALRTTMLSYLNHALGRSSWLYGKVSDIATLSIDSPKRAPQLNVREAYKLLTQLPTAHAEMARTMLLTGMGLGELNGKWEVLEDRVRIYGTKTEHRVRVVPLLVSNLSRPTRARNAFCAALRAVRADLSPYTFRRTFAHWMELANVPRSRRKLYLGHSTGDTTGGYEVSEVEQFLAEDAERLTTFIERERAGKAIDLALLTERSYDVIRPQ